MPRTRLIPDAEVFATVRRLLAEGGDKAVSFAAIARATGLAGPSLAQRYGTQDGMVQAALADAWTLLDAATARAEAEAPISPKGAVQLLKLLAEGAEAQGAAADLSLLAVNLRDPTLRARATGWRAQVERALSVRLGGGAKGAEAASLLFAAWQGQALWRAAGDKGFRLKDAARRLT